MSDCAVLMLGRAIFFLRKILFLLFYNLNWLALKMKPEILLRFAAVIMLLHTIGHTFGTISWKKTDDPVKKQIINQMTGVKFPFMAANRSLGETLEGGAVMGILALSLITVILWIASNSLTTEAVFVRNILIVIAIMLASQTIVEFIYFFPLAACFSALACLLIVAAIFQIPKM
jgi:hypothetical protein